MCSLEVVGLGKQKAVRRNVGNGEMFVGDGSRKVQNVDWERCWKTLIVWRTVGSRLGTPRPLLSEEGP